VYSQRWLHVSLWVLVLGNQGGGIHTEEDFNPWIRVCCLFSPGKFCSDFYSQDFLSFDSLSRDWILKLDPNDNFRKILSL
jgi:hypothetical protein